MLNKLKVSIGSSSSLDQQSAVVEIVLDSAQNEPESNRRMFVLRSLLER